MKHCTARTSSEVLFLRGIAHGYADILQKMKKGLYRNLRAWYDDI
jgi:hypothetical protein